MTNANIFVLIKTSSRRLLKTKTKDVFIKTNVCWAWIKKQLLTDSTVKKVSLLLENLFRFYGCHT